jgi:hypothetical protein
MTILAVIALPGINAGAGVDDLVTYTPLTDSNIKTAAKLWISDQTSATSTYGLVHSWDVTNVTDMSKSKSIMVVEVRLPSFVATVFDEGKMVERWLFRVKMVERWLLKDVGD